MMIKGYRRSDGTRVDGYKRKGKKAKAPRTKRRKK